MTPKEIAARRKKAYDIACYIHLAERGLERHSQFTFTFSLWSLEKFTDPYVGKENPQYSKLACWRNSGLTPLERLQAEVRLLSVRLERMADNLGLHQRPR